MADETPVDQMTVDVDLAVAPGTVLVRASGELDVFTTPLLRDALLGLPLESLSAAVVDLAGLTFIDSSGLGVLVAAQKKLRTGGGALRVVCDGGPVLRMLEITGLLGTITVFGTVDEALGTAP